MSILSQTTGAPYVHLVDPEGFDVPLNEKTTEPMPDPADPTEWSPWTDDWHWTPSDPADLAEPAAAHGMAFPEPRPGWNPGPTRDRHSVEALANIARLLADFDRTV